MIPLEDIIFIILCGNRYDSRRIPEEVRDRIISNYPDWAKVCVFNRLELPRNFQCYELWTVEGWQNEQERSKYRESLYGKSEEVKPTRPRKAVLYEINQALMENKYDIVDKLRKELNETKQ